MTDIRNAICRIKAVSTDYTLSEGTGFFIDSSRILTCNHIFTVLDSISTISFSLYDQPEQFHPIEIMVESEEYDFIILKITDSEFKVPLCLNLLSSTLYKDFKLRLYGYPDSSSIERTTGVDISVTVNGINSVFTQEVKHDLVFNLSSGNQVDHAGISGAPILNDKDEVVGIFKRQDTHTFGGISIKRAFDFFRENDVELRKDSLENFDNFLEKSFIGYEDRKTQCEEEAREIIKFISPQKILNSRKGDLFYPKKNKNLDEIILGLKTTKNINEQLWKGWLQLLTFVKLLKGDQNDINHIQITLSSSKIYKNFGIRRKKEAIETPMALNFYFTEEDTYSTIVTKYIHGEYIRGNLNANACHIFNSHQENFGSKIKSAKGIITDISGLKSSGPNIQGSHVAVLSLKQLRDEVINSNSLHEVTLNLQKLIENAIN